MAADSRYIQVSAHPQGETISFPCVRDRISIMTIKSVYPQATGLKHRAQEVQFRSSWEAVPLDKEEFVLPAGVSEFTIISGTIGQAHQILSHSGLASSVASAFQRPQQQNLQLSRPHIPLSVGRGSRKKGGLAKNQPSQRTYKVVFVKESELPVLYSRALVVMEGVVMISSQDDELTLRNKLMELLEGASCDGIEFLSYNAKTLSKVQCVSGFHWTGQNIKTLVGQGKMYIMAKGYRDTEMSQQEESESESLPEIIHLAPNRNTTNTIASTRTVTATGEETMDTDSTDTGTPTAPNRNPTNTIASTRTVTATGEETMDTDSTDTGTPTVTFHPQRHGRNRLSLSHRNETRSPHSSYMELINEIPCVIVDSSDDEEQQPQAHSGRAVPSESRSLYELLQELSNTLSDSLVKTKVNVTRANPLDGIRRSIHRTSFNPLAKLSVRFADDFGISEGAIDEGGPTRELFRLLLKQVADLPVFAPIDDAGKTVVLDASALNDGLYHDIGVVLALAVAHGGLLPKFLTETTYKVLVGGAVSPNVADIPDSDLRATVKQLQEATSSDSIKTIMNDNSMLFELAGCLRPVRSFSLEGRDKLAEDLIQFLVVGRNLPATQQLRQGLQTFGLLDLMKDNKERFREVFVQCQSAKLSADQVEAIFQGMDFSATGSNRRRAEERVIGFWRDYLIDIEDGNSFATFEDLLVFATGTDQVPFLGFSPDPSISFVHASGTSNRNLPQANTCAMVLKLPVAESYDDFKRDMDFGILNAPGFGQA